MDQDAVTFTLVIDDAGMHHRPEGGARIVVLGGVPFVCWDTPVDGGTLRSHLKLEHVRALETHTPAAAQADATPRLEAVP